MWQDPVLKKSWPSGHWPFFAQDAGCRLQLVRLHFQSHQASICGGWDNHLLFQICLCGKQACRIRGDGWMEIERRTLTPSNVSVVGSIRTLQMAVIRRYQRLLIID